MDYAPSARRASGPVRLASHSIDRRHPVIQQQLLRGGEPQKRGCPGCRQRGGTEVDDNRDFRCTFWSNRAYNELLTCTDPDECRPGEENRLSSSAICFVSLANRSRNWRSVPDGNISARSLAARDAIRSCTFRGWGCLERRGRIVRCSSIDDSARFEEFHYEVTNSAKGAH
jgi:hypothetical protein